MVHLGLAIVTYVFAVVQTLIPIAFGDHSGIVLQLMPVVVALAIVSVEGWPVIAWAAMAGLIGDCLSSQPLGIEMTAAILAAFSIRWSLANRRITSAVARSLVAATATFAIVAISNGTRVILARPPIGIREVIIDLTFSAVLSAAIAAFTVLCCVSINRFLPPVRRHTAAEGNWMRLRG